MRTSVAPPPKLFEPQRPLVELQPPQRAAALELLKALLTEALRASVAHDVPVPPIGETAYLTLCFRTREFV